jgi:hypothetical protein
LFNPEEFFDGDRHVDGYVDYKKKEGVQPPKNGFSLFYSISDKSGV